MTGASHRPSGFFTFCSHSDSNHRQSGAGAVDKTAEIQHSWLEINAAGLKMTLPRCGATHPPEQISAHSAGGHLHPIRVKWRAWVAVLFLRLCPLLSKMASSTCLKGQSFWTVDLRGITKRLSLLGEQFLNVITVHFFEQRLFTPRKGTPIQSCSTASPAAPERSQWMIPRLYDYLAWGSFLLGGWGISCRPQFVPTC